MANSMEFRCGGGGTPVPPGGRGDGAPAESGLRVLVLEAAHLSPSQHIRRAPRSTSLSRSSQASASVAKLRPLPPPGYSRKPTRRSHKRRRAPEPPPNNTPSEPFVWDKPWPARWAGRSLHLGRDHHCGSPTTSSKGRSCPRWQRPLLAIEKPRPLAPLTQTAGAACWASGNRPASIGLPPKLPRWGVFLAALALTPRGGARSWAQRDT